MENWERDMIEGTNRHADRMAAQREQSRQDMLRIAQALKRQEFQSTHPVRGGTAKVHKQ